MRPAVAPLDLDPAAGQRPRLEASLPVGLLRHLDRLTEEVEASGLGRLRRHGADQDLVFLGLHQLGALGPEGAAVDRAAPHLEPVADLEQGGRRAEGGLFAAGRGQQREGGENDQRQDPDRSHGARSFHVVATISASSSTHWRPRATRSPHSRRQRGRRR